jgi:hypothetical protein
MLARGVAVLACGVVVMAECASGLPSTVSGGVVTGQHTHARGQHGDVARQHSDATSQHGDGPTPVSCRTVHRVGGVDQPLPGLGVADPVGFLNKQLEQYPLNQSLRAIGRGNSEALFPR